MTYQLGDMVAYDTHPDFHGSVVCVHDVLDPETREVVDHLYGVAWEGEHEGSAGHVREERLVPLMRDVTATAEVRDADTLTVETLADLETVFTPEDADFLLEAGVQPVW